MSADLVNPAAPYAVPTPGRPDRYAGLPTLAETEMMVKAMAASGFYKEARDYNRALTLVLVGRDCGMTPTESLAGIHIIEGKPSFSATTLATQVKRSLKYDYEVREATTTVCRIEFFEIRNGTRHSLGESSYTIEQAKAAGLAGKDNWRKYPDDMLFARAISKGMRRYAPDALHGVPVYETNEMRDAIEVEATTAPPETPASFYTGPAAQAEAPAANDPLFDPCPSELRVAFFAKCRDKGMVEYEKSKDQYRDFFTTACGGKPFLRRSLASFNDLRRGEVQLLIDSLDWGGKWPDRWAQFRAPANPTPPREPDAIDAEVIESRPVASATTHVIDVPGYLGVDLPAVQAGDEESATDADKKAWAEEMEVHSFDDVKSAALLHAIAVGYGLDPLEIRMARHLRIAVRWMKAASMDAINEAVRQGTAA